MILIKRLNVLSGIRSRIILSEPPQGRVQQIKLQNINWKSIYINNLSILILFNESSGLYKLNEGPTISNSSSPWPLSSTLSCYGSFKGPVDICNNSLFARQPWNGSIYIYIGVYYLNNFGAVCCMYFEGWVLGIIWQNVC